MATAEVEIFNQALTLCGSPPVDSPDHSSKGAQLCKVHYPIVRDAVLRSHPWNCALLRVRLSRDNSSPVFGLTYKYALPSNPYCLRVLNVYPICAFVIEGRYLLSDSGEVYIRYISRVEDPILFDPMLEQVIAANLAAIIAPSVTQSKTVVADLWSLVKDLKRVAYSIDSQEGSPLRPNEQSWVEVMEAE